MLNGGTVGTATGVLRAGGPPQETMDAAYEVQRHHRGRLVDDLLAAWARLEVAERWAARTSLAAPLVERIVGAARSRVVAAEKAIEAEYA